MPKNDAPEPMSRAERALQKMVPVLRKECDKIREDLAASGSDDAKIRHRLGALVNDIQDKPDRYGQRGVEQLAAALGYDKTLLYRHAKVAACWSVKELSDLLRRQSVTGLPITFSHLQLLATVTSPKKREKYLDAVLTEGLSVRDLKRRLEPVAKAETEESSSTPDAARALRGLRVASETWLERVKLLEAEVLPALEGGPPTPELLPKYQQTLAQQQEFAERLSKLIARLSTWLGPEANGVAAPPRRGNGVGAQARAEAAEDAQPSA
jgi:hypothetical protein